MESPSKISVWLIQLSHIIFLVAILPLLVTGLRIAAANEPELIWLSLWLPQGSVHQWHFLSAILFTFSVMLYCVALFLRGSLPRLSNSAPSQFLFGLTHYLGMILLGLSSITGLSLFTMIYFLPIELVVTLHLYSAIGFFFYLLAHGSMAFIAMPWRKVLDFLLLLRVRGKVQFLIPILGVLFVGCFAWFFNRPETLVVVETQGTMEVDGDARELIWQQAPKLAVQTYQGFQQPAKGTVVSIQAAHDHQFAYFYLSWSDKTRSQTHVPLIKSDEGWRVLQTGLGHSDENHYYEDKFAIMLSESGQLAGAGTVQLGHKPSADQPGSVNKRGMHYTTDGSIADVWHWKSVRTGMSIGQADDNYFGPLSPSDSEYKRYTGGYQKDRDDCEHLVRWDGQDYQTKPECGGFIMNWRLYSDEIVTPIRLPKDSMQLARLGQIDHNADTSDFGAWWLDWEDTIAYHPDNDHYPVGTILPSVLSLGPFTQGRGDVTAAGHWRDGRWHLEMKRRLKSDSPYDLTIQSGIFLWVSTFDHSQTRHSYHIHPVKLTLDGVD